VKLEQALAFVELGWAVFPLVPNTKRPLTANGFKDASKSAYAVRKWWETTPDANIGIATGEPSGLAVVDVDVKNGAKGRESLGLLKGLEPTLTVATPSGGWHMYYLRPEGGLRCRNGLLPGIDLKADGGYVVGPGSEIDGRPYEWTDPEARVAALPACVLELMAERKSDPAPAAGEIIAEGRRNETLASLAGTMRRRGMSAEEIAAALKTINANRCRPPLPDEEIETISASIARYTPESSAPNANEEQPSEHDSEDEAVPPGFTDDALALEFTQAHAGDWRYVAAWGHWLHWDGSCWHKEATLKAYDLARLICRAAAARCLKPKIAAKVASAATVAAVERLARADRRHAATVDIWDSDPWLLNTPGGVVDLRTGELKPHERTGYLTKIAAATPGMAERQPARWLAFLHDVTKGDGELQRYLARMAGYALTGVTTEHALFFFYGTGANGKSVFLNTLAAVFGDYATNAPMDTFIETRSERHPTDLAGLRGARLVTSIEIEKGRRWAEAKIKSLTGGDKIAARFMRQDFFEYRPQFKLLIAGNHKPSIRDVDEAMRRRLHLVPFIVTIPRERRDRTLPERLLEERGAILRWAIEGCLEWQRTGLRPPASVVSATEEYFESEDALGRWIEEACSTGPNKTAKTTELFTAWKNWAEQTGEFVGSLKKFSQDLEARGFRKIPGARNAGFVGLAPIGGDPQEEML
jgi:putative DNA primase/helicase